MSRQERIEAEQAVRAKMQAAVASFRSDGDSYPNWTTKQRSRIAWAADQLVEAEDADDEQRWLRVLYDLITDRNY